MVNKDFKLRRGLKDIFAAEVIKDDKDGFTVGTPFKLIPAGEMKRIVNSDKTNVWFDDGIWATAGTEGATDIEISGASLRSPGVARILGKKIDSTTGAVIDSGNFVEKYYALGGRAKGLDGTLEYFWFLKGTFTAPEEDDKTDDESTDTNGMTLNYSAIKTRHIFTDGDTCKRIVIDTETTKIKTGKVWTEQVVTPDNLATIAEKVIPVTGITMSDATATVAEGATKQLTVTLSPVGATGVVNWYTSNAAVATVSDEGLVSAVDAGTAIITAICDGFAAVCTVTVTE